MFGDSENDADAARAANIPMILLEDGYTDKKIEQIYHNHLITDFVNVELSVRPAPRLKSSPSSPLVWVS